MVKISVIIPVYNCAQLLAKCLDSVCGQTLRDLEIVCVNDASTDNSLAILQEYATKDQRIKLINFSENKGAAVARNIAIDNALGEYLGFVDADDFIDRNFYEKLYEVAQKNDSEVVKANIALYCPKEEKITYGSWIDINYKVKKHQAHFCFSFTSAIFKTAIIKENSVNFLQGLNHFEDPYFTIKAVLFYKKLQVIEDVFYYYVENSESSSRKKVGLKHIESMMIGAVKILDLLDEKCSDKTHYMIVFNFVLEQLLHWCNRTDVSDEITIKAASALSIILQRCRYKDELASYHFLEKKKTQKDLFIRELRNKVKLDLKNA